MNVAGLFAGIGGLEVGLERAGHSTSLLCEINDDARMVLRDHWPAVPITPDVLDVRGLSRETDVVTAGFPCTDISQAGLTAGISGSQSGLVGEVFRLVRRRYPTFLVIENVQNMLVLGKGAAMRHITDELDAMKMRWAYRVVDSRAFGVPQRRRRVILVASRTEDPRQVLFVDDAGLRPQEDYADDAYGFYWTEGLRGLGWAQDATPTLKGGSTIGIPSPPGIWLPEGERGRRLVMPGVGDAEELQGFDRNWTKAVEGPRARGARLKLLGNAVTVGVAEWVGHRLAEPETPHAESRRVTGWVGGWPTAAWGSQGERWEVTVSEFPVHHSYQHLAKVVDIASATPVSHRGAAGFLSRTRRAKLRFDPAFLADVEDHVDLTATA
jgi:DNA (cytosine-5)-methyltransferase 1